MKAKAEPLQGFGRAYSTRRARRSTSPRRLRWRPPGARRARAAFQSANAWDAHAATALGMKVVRCNRYGQKRERLPGQPDFEIRSLVELPTLLAVPPAEHAG